MKTTVYTLIFLFSFLSFNIAHGQTDGTLEESIIRATRNANSVELANYFNQRIELILPDKSGVFSKEQAQFLMKEFFDSYKPLSFEIIHQGIRENATFAIGRYHYNNGQFRILFLAKTIENQMLIHQIRIEPQDG